MGDAGLGLITAFHYDHNHQSAKNKKFVADYNADFKRNPDMFSVGGYDGMHVIYEALKKTNGDTDGDKLIAAAKGMAGKARAARCRSTRRPATSSRTSISAGSRRSAATGQCRVRQDRERQGPVQGADEEVSARS